MRGGKEGREGGGRGGKEGERERHQSPASQIHAPATPPTPGSLEKQGSDPKVGPPSPLWPIVGGTSPHTGQAGPGRGYWLHSCWPEATRLACLYSSSCFFPISWCFWLPTSPLPAREEITPLGPSRWGSGKDVSGNSQNFTRLPALHCLISSSPSVEKRRGC